MFILSNTLGKKQKELARGDIEKVISHVKAGWVLIKVRPLLEHLEKKGIIKILRRNKL